MNIILFCLQIVPEDGLPHVVCHACATRLSRCFMFRQRARRAQRRLRARSTHATDIAQECDPESDEGNSYTQSAPAGDCEFSDDDHGPENTRIDGHACSKSIPEARDRNLSDRNRLSINDHGLSNSSSKNNFDNSCNKNNEIEWSENDNSHSESSHKKDKSCSESSRKKDKTCPESSHKKDKSCSEGSNNNKEKSCLESSHKKDKSFTDSRNEDRKVNKSNIFISNSKKSKKKSLKSKLNKNKLTIDTAINKSVLNEFLENDINELLSDEKLNYKSESSENCTNYVTSNLLFNTLQKHDSCDSPEKQCKIEKKAEKKNGIDDTNYICERDTYDCGAFRIDIEKKDVCSVVISHKNNDVTSLTKDTGDFNEVGEDVTSSNELVRNDDEVKATKTCDETGDSEGAVAGDRAVSWCDSDEEKLLHTALKMSIVRHSQDWEIKRETEVCDM